MPTTLDHPRRFAEDGGESLRDADGGVRPDSREFTGEFTDKIRAGVPRREEKDRK
jgi:hypothetical protein